LEELLLQLEALLWNRKLDKLRGLARFALQAIRFVYALIRDVVTTTLTLRAMGLVYTTILSIVPALALIFSILKGLGYHRSKMEPALLKVFEPLGDKGAEITGQLIGFIDNVQGGLLGGLGLLFLIYTTISLIRKIEESVNFIWRVDGARNLLQSFGEYLGVLLVGLPVMLTAAALIAAVGSNAMVDRMLSIEVLGATAVLVGKLMPYLLVSLFFAMIYWFIPNTRVKFRYALLGGLVGGLLWSACGVLFATFVVTSARNATIYGSFAIVVVALMWLYISWLIVLVGAQASFYAQNLEYLRIGYRQLSIGNQVREQAALSMMLLTAKTFRSGEKAKTANQIAEILHIPGVLLTPVRQRLVAAHLLEVSGQERLIPARDPTSISLMDVVTAMRTTHDEDVYQGGRWPDSIKRVAAEVNDKVREVLDHRSLYDLLDESPKTKAKA
jgi:membrane protein